jgi:hypothetical protein
VWCATGSQQICHALPGHVQWCALVYLIKGSCVLGLWSAPGTPRTDGAHVNLCVHGPTISHLACKDPGVALVRGMLRPSVVQFHKETSGGEDMHNCTQLGPVRPTNRRVGCVRLRYNATALKHVAWGAGDWTGCEIS